MTIPTAPRRADQVPLEEMPALMARLMAFDRLAKQARLKRQSSGSSLSSEVDNGAASCHLGRPSMPESRAGERTHLAVTVARAILIASKV